MALLTRFERTRLISARALQLSLGAPVLVKAAKHHSSLEIAKRELEEVVLPLAVLREFPDGSHVRVELV